jgi:quercetin dioxygenase-like cupin family protein
MVTTIPETLKSNERRRAFPGTVFNVIKSGAETNNNMFIADVEGIPGSEPPRHVHTREDEIVIIKEGTITYFVGDDIISAVPGDTVVLPKNVPHNFVITSEKMKVTLVTTSGSFGEFFCRMSVPYSDKNIPMAQRPSEERRKEIKALMDEYGIYYIQ